MGTAEANAAPAAPGDAAAGSAGPSAGAALDDEAAMLAQEAAEDAKEAAASQRKADLKAAKRAAKKEKKKGANKNRSLLASFHNTKDARKAARIEAASAVGKSTLVTQVTQVTQSPSGVQKGQRPDVCSRLLCLCRGCVTDVFCLRVPITLVLQVVVP